MMSARASVLGLLLLVPAAIAQDFNLDFQSPTSTHGVPSATYGAAANRPGTWQKIDADFTSGLTAIDGGSTAVDLRILSQMGYFFDGNNGGTSGDDDALLDDTHQAYPDVTYRFENLTPGHYRVYTIGLEIFNNAFAWEIHAPTSLQGTYDLWGQWGGGYGVTRSYVIHDVFVQDGTLQIIGVSKEPLHDNSQVSGMQLVLVDEPGGSYCYGVYDPPSNNGCGCQNREQGPYGCRNSSGVGARLFGSGSASYVADDLRMIGTDLVHGQAALLYVGTTKTYNGYGLTFGDGLRCVSGSIVRLGIKVANGGGQAFWGPGLGALGGWQPGDTRLFQIWYRDPSGPCSSGYNLSNGYQVLIEP